MLIESLILEISNSIIYFHMQDKSEVGRQELKNYYKISYLEVRGEYFQN